MKKLLVFSMCFILASCASTPVAVPVTAKFPGAPDVLIQECEKLKQLDQGAKLSDVMIAITENYMKYHECSLKVKGWNTWYVEQKRIFDNATGIPDPKKKCGLFSDCNF